MVTPDILSDPGTAISKEQFLESTRTLATDPVAARATDGDGQLSAEEFT